MHEFELEHEHDELSDAEQEAIARSILEQETITLRTVGIDIGSSTSHLLFARVVLRRESEDLSSRFVVVERQIVWHSSILLTPFRLDGTIDAHALAHFIQDAYRDAGLRRADIDSGAVILTGEAIKRKNARAIDEIFAKEAGKFVCATAGHKLECILAAHGSGAVALSRRRGVAALHVDIGGGTTKLALIDGGEIKSVAAVAVGGRLVATNETGAWARIDDSARLVARDLGIAAAPDRMADESVRRAVARRLAKAVVDQIVGAPPDDLGRALELTEPLDRSVQPEFISFSGGVAEYVFDREAADYGDIARLLAVEIRQQMKERCRVPVIEPAERIRATVIGASQFTVQVSGKTIYLSHANVLPVNNIPVVHLGLDLSDDIDEDAIVDAFGKSADLLDLAPEAKMALAFTFLGEPNYPRLAAIARSIIRFAGPRRGELLVLMIEGDIGRGLGRLIHKELGFGGTLISIDGIRLQQLDFVDIGELIDPPGVVPVVIKSLLFS